MTVILNPSRIILPPTQPTGIFQFMGDPIRMVRFSGIPFVLALHSSVFRAEVQTAPLIAAVWLRIVADVGQSPVDLFVATRFIAICGNGIADVTIPIIIKPD